MTESSAAGPSPGQRPVRSPDGAAADVRSASAAKLVFQALRRQILSLELAPGARLIEAEIARASSTSRGPVREALAELARVGLVEQVPRRGARVAYPTLAQIHCEFEIRTALLALAARLACQRAGEGERAAIVAEIDAVHCVIGEGAAPLEIVAQGVRLSRRINAASGSRDVSDMLEAAHQRAEWHYSHIGDRLGAFVDRVDACWIDARDGFLRHDADRVETAVRTSMRIVQRETVAHLVSIGFGAPG